MKIKKIPKKPQKGWQKFIQQFITVVVIGLLLLAIFSNFSDNNNLEKKDSKEISLTEIARLIENKKVKKISTSEGIISVTIKNTKENAEGKKNKKDDVKIIKTSKKELGASVTETLVNLGVSPEKLKEIEIEEKAPSSLGYYFSKILPLLLFSVLIFFIFMMFKSKKGGSVFSFGDSKDRYIDPNDKKNRVTFKDIAGAEEAKVELMEIVDFLKSPKKYIEIGAETPKGVLLKGSPGTGKTLLARAVAGEARVPFYSVSGSDFVEMFVGVGASRVRDLFKKAKDNAPAIIFIDEIDAIGRARGSGTGGGNDEREQTLNQILVEMDGFEKTEKVIVMAATNRPEILDPAILRPGRFDRKVTIELPDKKGRLSILKIHSKKKPLAEDVDLEVIAERTVGFSGAELASVMNEGAILAARNKRKKVTQNDLIVAVEKVSMGPERKTNPMTEDDKIHTAYHEIGHALVASVLKYSDPVHKVSVIPRGSAGGYTMNLPFDDKKNKSKKEYLDDLAIFMGGYVAEKKVYGDVTTGPYSDLQRASDIARNMVTKFGMSEELGKTTYHSNQMSIDHSEDIMKKIDTEVSKIIDEAEKRAKKVLDENEKAFHEISHILALKETLERDEFEELLKKYGIKIKEKKEHMKLNFNLKIPRYLEKSISDIKENILEKNKS